MSSLKDTEFFYFRSEFDKTLKLFFKENNNISSVPRGFNISIPAVSCLILLTEREKERREFLDNPPEQYSKDTFFEDIENSGIGVDDFFLKTFKDLIDEGFIKDSGREIYLAERGEKVINWLDSVFPGMPGISFLAYIVQTLDEVYTDRKSLSRGKEVFYQTLRSRCVTKDADHSPKITKIDFEECEKVSINTENLKQRLQEIRKSGHRNDQEYFLKYAEVKPVFNKSFDEKTQEHAEPEKDEEVCDIEPESIMTPEKETLPTEDNIQSDESELEIKDIVESGEALSVKPDNTKMFENVEVVSEETIEESTKQIPLEETHKDIIEDTEELKEDKEEDHTSSDSVMTEAEIAARISAFEEQLAIECPVCGNGKVIENQTEKGKVFYQCTNNLCHFISWAKPFYYSCPLCKNPFLIEVLLQSGVKGLKCPRATCDYVQEDQVNPEQKEAPKKKKRVVRRVRRKR